MKIDKYFDKFSFAGLVLLLPSTIIIISILLRAVIPVILIETLFDMIRIINPHIVMNIASTISLIICFADIIKINHKNFSDKYEERFVYQKSFLDVALIFVNSSYIILIYLYYDLVKLGNIPVGRN